VQSSSRINPPAGFMGIEVSGGILMVRAGFEEEAAGAGLRSRETWERLLLGAAIGSGRGGAARLVLPGGSRVVLKRMRRGGVMAPVWRERFPGTGRLLANLTVPMEAISRGVPTPEPVAMLMMEGPRRMFSAWIALTEITGTEDLLTRLRRPPAPGIEEMRSVLETVRRTHDAGLRHRDLNLGNLLVGDGEEGWTVHIIDLDRADMAVGPLSYGERLSSLRRLERSYEKHLGREKPLGDDAGLLWYTLYAGSDRQLGRRLQMAGRVGRILLSLHRLTWRRPG